MNLNDEHHATQIFISLTSFGATDVREHGQCWFTDIAHRAGADGVEVRGELLVDAGEELPALAQRVAELGLDVVYSSPAPLWTEQGALDEPALVEALAYAGALGARRLKMSIGHFGACTDAAPFARLNQILHASSVQLLIENDQTESAGTRVALQRFFAAADRADLILPMTFDVGNWHWTGECPLQAAATFAHRVHYVHCKGVQRQPHRWVAVPLSESAAPWRAVTHALPTDVPWAIEYPLIGEDLVAVTRQQIEHLRATARHQQGAPA